MWTTSFQENQMTYNYYYQVNTTPSETNTEDLLSHPYSNTFHHEWLDKFGGSS